MFRCVCLVLIETNFLSHQYLIMDNIKEVLSSKLKPIDVIRSLSADLVNVNDELNSETSIKISSPDNTDNPNCTIIRYDNIKSGGITFFIVVTYNNISCNYNLDIGMLEGTMHIANLFEKSEIYEKVNFMFIKTYDFLLKYKFYTLLALKK